MEVSKTSGKAKQGKGCGRHGGQTGLKEKRHLCLLSASNTGTRRLPILLPITAVGFKKILFLNYVYMGSKDVQRVQGPTEAKRRC